MHSEPTATLFVVALLVACQRDTELPTASTTLPSPAPALAAVRPRDQQRLERLSTMPMLVTSKRLGVTTIKGKSLGARRSQGVAGPKRRLDDVPIGNHPTGDENEPTVVASPRDKRRLVAGYHFITSTVRCQARHSSNGGSTWSAPVVMPQLTGQSQCSDPVLAYSPDGRRVYYAYMDLKFDPNTFASDFDILVSYSDDDGSTWTGPVIALNGAEGVFDYDKPWIATPDDATGLVYLTATRFDAAGPCSIAFTRSTNRGVSYTAPVMLEAGGAACGFGSSAVVQGSRPAGGRHGNVLVAWYSSGSDGWLVGSFEIRVRRSADFGATFGPVHTAASDGAEAAFWKGPFACYERWWGAMYPDVELGPNGAAHIAYTHDPAPGSATAEEGDVRYVTSPGPPYAQWSTPVTVNDDHSVSAQGYIALEIKAEGAGQSARPHAIWEDHRLPLETADGPDCLSYPDLENLEYDVFYSTRQGGRWSRNVRLSDHASRSDYIFNGDYIDLTSASGSLFGIWTDRRDKLSVFDLEDDVWGSRTHRVLVAAVP